VFSISAAKADSKTDDIDALRTENVSIKNRLEKLEELIYSSQERRPSKSRRLESIEPGGSAFPSPSTTISNAPDTEVARNYKGDTQWLEGQIY
jgi:hypothetical protein